MADYVAIASRRISGTGIIKIPVELSNLRKYTLFADIIRYPQSRNFNADYSPPKSFYARVNLISQGYVIGTFPLEWESEKWEFIADQSGQNLIAIKCMYDGLLETFVNLGEALNLTVVSVENTIGAYYHLPLFFDQINVQIFADAAFQFNLIGLPYDYCQLAYSVPNPQPTPPTKPTPVPIGTPTNISEPYAGDTTTNPAPIDDGYVPPPSGIACQVYNVALKYQRQDTPGTDFNVTVGVYGQIGRVRVSPSNANNIELECQGNSFNQPCVAFGWYTVYTVGQTLTGVQIVSF